MTWLNLEDKIVVVTGAGGGIGSRIAVDFAKQGARVVVMERNATAGSKTVEKINKLNIHEPLSLSCDVSDPISVSIAATTLEKAWGNADILINNAAVMATGTIADMDITAWNKQLAVNLNGYLLCSQHFGAQMRAKGKGAIVHIASISGSNPQGNSGAYSVSKAGILMLSKQIATEWGKDNIRSNCISPGMIETPLTEGFYKVEGIREKRESVTPTGRIGLPRDISDAALFLASDRASFITGEEVTVDGGYTKMLMNLIPRPGY
jgi:NAD(P)-dependent dehydrogenase (short-subunit alcohol dehydrogenase family)